MNNRTTASLWSEESQNGDQQPQQPGVSLVKRFLLTTLLPSLIFFMACGFIEWREGVAIENRLVRQQEGVALLLVEGVSETIRDILVNRQHALLGEEDSPVFSREMIAELAWELSAQVQYSNYYDQLRVLDQRGKEIIRINQGEEGPLIVPRSQLQDKSSRYYFQEGIGVPPGHIYLSPLDLNVERGEIEVPHKPMLRVAAPVAGADGKPKFLLVSNIRVKVVFDKLMTHINKGESRLSVLDSRGYFLVSPDTETTFGWQIPERSSQQLSLLNPDRWKLLQADAVGIGREGLTVYSWYRLNLPKALVLNLNRCTGDERVPTDMDQVETDCDYGLLKGIEGLSNGDPIYLLSSQKIEAILGSRQVLFGVAVLFICLQAVILVLVKRRSEIDYLRRTNEINLTKLAYKDPLTGLHNRRSFTDLYHQEAARGLRSGKMCSLVLLDIDHFKQVNDTYGHDRGDQVLTILSEVIISCLRTSDQAARHGGEEFAILLPETTLQEAVDIAERVRLRCEKEVGNQARLEQAVTVSVGVSHASEEAHELSALLKRADDNLYRAKEGGRNRVVWQVEQA